MSAAAGDTALCVAFEGRRVGDLERAGDGELSFAYAQDWLDEGFAISLSLPLRDEPFGPEAQRFFANLLPEGIVRQLVARRLGISEDNDWQLLAALGGDCAGALTLTHGLPPGEPPSYRDLSLAKLRELAAAPHPGLAAIGGDEDVRLSLAGAQDKLPVRLTDTGDYQLPLGTAASTHILKFASRDFAHLTANEVLVTRLARRLGLPVVEVELDTRFDPPLCVVERYDRRVEAGGTIRRLHQEDVCQALGLPHTRKYEIEGGPDLPRVNALLGETAADPIGATGDLLRWQVFCLLAGNADGHAKNLSLIHDRAAPRLAPFYDLVCTRAYGSINRRLALSVAGSFDPGQIARADWLRLGERLDVRPQYVVELVGEIADKTSAALDATLEELREEHGDLQVLPMVRPLVLRQVRRTRRLLAGR